MRKRMYFRFFVFFFTKEVKYAKVKRSIRLFVFLEANPDGTLLISVLLKGVERFTSHPQILLHFNCYSV